MSADFIPWQTPTYRSYEESDDTEWYLAKLRMRIAAMLNEIREYDMGSILPIRNAMPGASYYADGGMTKRL